MGAVKVIINKELKVAFNSLLIYIAYTAFLCVTGFVCWFSGKNIFSSGQASLSNLFNVFYWTLFFLIPALTMKSISENARTELSNSYSQSRLNMAANHGEILCYTITSSYMSGIDTPLLYHDCLAG